MKRLIGVLLIVAALCALLAVPAGAAKPVILLSRSDDAETKLNSIALGAVAS